MFSSIDVKNGFLIYNCFNFNKYGSVKFDENLKNRFKSLNKLFVLLFQKCAYSEEYMDSWEKYKETLLSSIESCYIASDLKSISKPNH